MVSITAFVLCHYIAGLVPDPQIDGTVRDTLHQAGNHMSMMYAKNLRDT